MKIKIPLTSHVYKFLTSPEMLGEKQPIEVRKDSLLGTLIIMVASKGTIELSDYYADRLDPAPVEGDAVEWLELETTFPLKEEFLAEENLLYVSNALEAMFQHFVIFFSLGYVARMGSERGAIRILYERFGLEDDPVKQESLRAICKRYRKKVRENYKTTVQKKHPKTLKNLPIVGDKRPVN